MSLAVFIIVFSDLPQPISYQFHVLKEQTMQEGLEQGGGGAGGWGWGTPFHTAKISRHWGRECFSVLKAWSSSETQGELVRAGRSKNPPVCICILIRSKNIIGSWYKAFRVILSKVDISS